MPHLELSGHEMPLDLLAKQLKKAKTTEQLHQAIVNAPFSDPLAAALLDLGVVVLLLVNKKTQTIDRVALSDTYSAKGAVRMSAKPFHDIKIPVDYKQDYVARTIASAKPHATNDWKYLFIPALTTKDAHFNQAGAGIESSTVYPLPLKQGGALIFSFYQPVASITKKHHAFMQSYCALVSTYLQEG
jgi:hypothetical protein